MAYIKTLHAGSTWIRYERVDGAEIAVFRNDRKIGAIRPDGGGFRFVATGQRYGGPVHASISAVKREIET